MTVAECKQLNPGDEVYWEDPAAEDDPEGDCSRHIVIRSIHVQHDDEDAVISISYDGGNLECFAHELA